MFYSTRHSCLLKRRYPQVPSGESHCSKHQSRPSRMATCGPNVQGYNWGHQRQPLHTHGECDRVCSRYPSRTSDANHSGHRELSRQNFPFCKMGHLRGFERETCCCHWEWKQRVCGQDLPILHSYFSRSRAQIVGDIAKIDGIKLTHLYRSCNWILPCVSREVLSLKRLHKWEWASTYQGFSSDSQCAQVGFYPYTPDCTSLSMVCIHGVYDFVAIWWLSLNSTVLGPRVSIFVNL